MLNSSYISLCTKDVVPNVPVIQIRMFIGSSVNKYIRHITVYMVVFVCVGQWNVCSRMVVCS